MRDAAFEAELAAERLAARAARLLDHPQGAVVATDMGYAVLLGRRRRPMLTLDEAAFRVLSRSPGLVSRREGGWSLARPAPVPPPGRLGVIEGETTVVEDGARLARRANLGESPLAWLARRGALSAVEMAAGERLRDDFQKAGTLGRLTMRWDGLPHGEGGGPRLEPAEQARAVKARIAAALKAVGPGLKEILERVCLAETALTVAERELKLPARSGKMVLKLALQRLVIHYGM